MRLVGYVRVSRVNGREGDNFISPAVQREQIEKYAELRGFTIIEWVEDLDQPGNRADRPGFQRALAMVESGETDGLAAAKLNRLARSVADGYEALRRLRACDGTLVLVAEGVDTTTSMGKAMFGLMLVFAELELDNIRDQWAIARDRAIERGVHISRVPPVGYVRGADARLEPDPKAAPVVRELFRRRAKGQAWRSLCDYLNTQLPRDNGGSWAISSLTSIVGNRVYLGEARAGEMVNRSAHEPIVRRAEWEAAQAVPRAAKKNGGALLTGLIRCAGCGHTMTPNSGGARGYSRYDCRKRHSDGICPAPAALSMPRADAFVEAEFLARIEQETITVEGSPTDDDLERAIARLEAAEAELTAYRDETVIRAVGREMFAEGLKQRVRRVEEAQAEVGEKQRLETADVPDYANLRDEWPGLAVDEKRLILGAAIDEVRVQLARTKGKGTPVEQRARIIWRGEN